MTKNIFQIIDFDRTLFDISGFAKAITDEINILHPGIGDQLDAQFEEAYQNEQTFFLFRHLRQEMGDEALEVLVAVVIARTGPEKYMLPGWKERLALADELTTARPSWGLLTYGDEIDQRMKLKMVGFENIPTVLTGTPEKGQILASWQNDDGTFTLPVEYGGQTVDAITFEDDKLRAFYDLPVNLFPVWISQYEDAAERSKQVNPSIVVAKNLFESAQHLKEKFL